MKLPRQAVGRYVELVWRDPCRTVLRGCKPDFGDVEVSEAALPRQQERGVIGAVRSGIILLIHTACTESGLGEDTQPTYSVSFIPEDRVERVVFMVPEDPAAAAPPAVA